VASHRTLGRYGGLDRIHGTREGNEEAIPLRTYLVAAMSLNGRAQQAPVLLQDPCVPITQALEELGRAFDVGEKECDGSDGQRPT
jgi:hypothetical protein